MYCMLYTTPYRSGGGRLARAGRRRAPDRLGAGLAAEVRLPGGIFTFDIMVIIIIIMIMIICISLLVLLLLYVTILIILLGGAARRGLAAQAEPWRARLREAGGDLGTILLHRPGLGGSKGGVRHVVIEA